jgi:hypothetical protein
MTCLRVLAVLGEVHRQQDGLRAQARRLHQPHGRAHAELPRRVGGGGDHAAAHVVRSSGKKSTGIGQIGQRPRAFGTLGVQALDQLVLAPSRARR